MLPTFLNYNNRIDYLELLVVTRGGGAEVKSSCVVPIPGAPKENTIMKTVLDAVALVGGESGYLLLLVCQVFPGKNLSGRESGIYYPSGIERGDRPWIEESST
jgi:hypothetical protein